MSHPVNNNNGGNSSGQQVGAQFGFPTSGQIIPNGTDPVTGHASAASAADSMAGTFVDPNGIVGGLYNDIMGFTSQSREFAQQEYMQDKQNQWNSASAQMARAKAAGINPLTAAGGIAGNGSSGYAPAGGSASPTGLSDVGSAISAVGGLPADVASKKANADAAQAAARNADRLADASIFKDAASAASLLTAAGAPEIAAMEIGLSFARNGLDGFSNAFNANNLCRRFDLENDELDALINTENQRFADLQQLTRLHSSEADNAAALATHQNIINDIESKRRDLVNRYEELAMGDGFLAEFAFMRKYGVDSEPYKAYMNFIQDKFYNQSKGTFDADIDTAFSRFYNQFKAKADVDSAFAPYMKKIDVMGEALKEFTRSMLENPSSIDGAITTFMNKIFVALYGTQINFDDVNSATVPTPGNADRSNRGN